MQFIEKINTHVIFLCCFFLLGACDVSYNEAIGNYSIKYSHGTETLKLNADATYTQTYVNILNGKTFTRKGKWRLNPKYSQVELENAMATNKIVGFADTVPIENPDKNAGSKELPIHKFLGTIELVVSDDLNLYYIKD